MTRTPYASGHRLVRAGLAAIVDNSFETGLNPNEPKVELWRTLHRWAQVEAAADYF
jgi:hypothetical protein